METVETLKERAFARSATILALDSAYGGKSESRTEESASVTPKGPPVATFQSVLAGLTSNGNDRLYSQLTDAFGSKSILLDNINAQSAASSNKAKEKRKLRQIQSTVASKKKLRGLNFLDSFENPTIEVLHLLANNWSIFINKSLATCQNISQMQSRMQSVELIGAQVIVLEAQQPKLTNVSGIMMDGSKNNYYIAALTKKGKSPGDDPEKLEYSIQVRKVPKKATVLSVFIPPQESPSIDNLFQICNADRCFLIYGPNN